MRHANENLKSIDTVAFKNCKNLKSVFIPKTVTTIGAQAFSLDLTSDSFTRIYSLENIYFGGNSEEWAKVEWKQKDDYSSIVSFYSETEPTTAGNFWHYVNGKPAAWN